MLSRIDFKKSLRGNIHTFWYVYNYTLDPVSKVHFNSFLNFTRSSRKMYLYFLVWLWIISCTCTFNHFLRITQKNVTVLLILTLLTTRYRITNNDYYCLLLGKANTKIDPQGSARGLLLFSYLINYTKSCFISYFNGFPQSYKLKIKYLNTQHMLTLRGFKNN